ncbi:MAG: hypothetical protein V7750_01335 [Sneathiella sp.]
MYLKTLSALTATFLAVLLIIMVQTVPMATTVTTAGEYFPLLKANCLSLEMVKEVILQRI